MTFSGRDQIAADPELNKVGLLPTEWVNIGYLSKAIRPGSYQRRVNVDFPVRMIESLDKEAKRLGVTRQSIIKVWIAERLKKHA